MSMYTDIVWREQGNTEKCEKNQFQLRIMLADVRAFVLGFRSENKWYETCSDKPDGEWDTTVERLMLNFAESGHPIFRATSAP